MATPPRPDQSSTPEGDSDPVVSADPAMKHTLRLLDIARGDDDGRGIAHVALDSLRAGADVNYPDPATGLTALHYAAAYDKVNLVRLIVQVPSCDFTIMDRKGRTAATLAYEVAENSVMGRFLLTKEKRQRRRDT
jgi:hypothetical protein